MKEVGAVRPAGTDIIQCDNVQVTKLFLQCILENEIINGNNEKVFQTDVNFIAVSIPRSDPTS